MKQHLNEAEWTVSGDPHSMLRARRGHINSHPRKARLFAVACCERINHLLADERSRAAVDAAAQYAEGLADAAQVLTAYRAAGAAHDEAFQQKGKLSASAE